jgi:hypothetical protein
MCNCHRLVVRTRDIRLILSTSTHRAVHQLDTGKTDGHGCTSTIIQVHQHESYDGNRRTADVIDVHVHIGVVIVRQVRLQERRRLVMVFSGETSQQRQGANDSPQYTCYLENEGGNTIVSCGHPVIDGLVCEIPSSAIQQREQWGCDGAAIRVILQTGNKRLAINLGAMKLARHT